MNQFSESDIFRDFRPRSLEEVLEFCILSLESGRSPDRKMIEERFPQWSADIFEFLDNWDDIEELATSLTHADPTENRVDDAPESFGDYEISEQIGAGGMGTIYRARQISLNREVAIKMIHGSRLDRERFRLEAEAAASLEHPNIVSIYDIGEVDGRLFFTMQLIEGCDLQQHIQKKLVTPTEAARIARTISNAVHYAHQHGILHRDLKPANIMLDANANPHITDFGLAKRIEKDLELTNSGAIVGTPGYMAPEQAAGAARSITIATDVYGLGAILFALLTGEAPFTGKSSLNVLRRVIDEPARSPRTINSTIHRDLETICLKCLEKKSGFSLRIC